MEIVLRSAAVFVFLWFLTRVIGKVLRRVLQEEERKKASTASA